MRVTLLEEARMRGDDREQAAMWSYVSPEARVPRDHPLRPMRQMVDEALKTLSPQFTALYATTGRPSIPPEKLLRALLVQILYTIRSERLLMEQLEYNLLFRWFVGLEMDDPVWDHSTFTKNRDRLLAGDIARRFFEQVLGQARARRLLSTEHFTVDGTLVEAWAGQKSFQRKDRPPRPPEDPGNASVDFRGERRSNLTHASTTDPEARLTKRGPGQEAKLGYHGHLVIENGHGFAVAAALTEATGFAERATGLALVAAVPRRRGATLGGDKGYDTADFVDALRRLGVVPHVAQNISNRSSAIDGRTTRHSGYGVSQQKRKRIEEVFGWLKTIGLMRQTRHRGTLRVGWMFVFAVAAYNLVRLRNLTWTAA